MLRAGGGPKAKGQKHRKRLADPRGWFDHRDPRTFVDELT